MDANPNIGDEVHFYVAGRHGPFRRAQIVIVGHVTKLDIRGPGKNGAWATVADSDGRARQIRVCALYPGHTADDAATRFQRGLKSPIIPAA